MIIAYQGEAMLPDNSLSREELLKAFKNLGLDDLCDNYVVFIQADINENEGINVSDLLEIVKDNFGDTPLDKIKIAASEVIEADDGGLEIGPVICLFIEEDNEYDSWIENPPSVN